MFRFFTGGNGFIQFFKDGGHGFFEFWFPIKSATLCGDGAIGVHPVHSVFIYKTNETLCEFFNGFIKSFARCMAVFAEFIILGFHNTCKTSHEHATFADKITVGFVWKCGGEKISRSDCDTDGKTAFFRPTCCVLPYCITGIDAGAGEKIATDIKS